MTVVCVVETAHLDDARQNDLRRLVFGAFDDGEFDDEDWEHALGGWHVIAADDDGELLGHGAVVARRIEVDGRPFDTGYVEAVATSRARQRAGVGSLVMADLATIIRRDFELGALATGRHAFYARLGWEPWRGPTFVRDGDGLVRTPDEDDAIMVLRFGPSAGIDLGSSIACEPRRGDDW